MQADDPPYLSVGTAVSAKYKGAFCEAKVSKVVRIVKCKVTYKMGLGNGILNDEQIKGTLRVGQVVQAKHPDRKELVEATITKIQDCSQYTVVFDDGDITTLRRTALCLKSGRHFNESETLDQLPLTHPEHFGIPVMGGRRGRRSRQLKDDSSDGEVEEENEPDLEGYLSEIGRVVSVESTEKKRNKENWFPGLVVIPSAQPTVRINAKDEYLIRSFKDGRYYTVPKKEVSEFNRESGAKVDNPSLGEAIQKAIKFLDLNELPPHWEKNTLFHSTALESDSDENFSDSSDDESYEEKDRFVAQLYKFMDDAGTPLNKTPVVAGRDIDLHRLFRVVQKLGGGNRVTNQNKWRTVTARLRLPVNQAVHNQVRSAYKKCLASYETFYRTLGVTMINHTRPPKKNRGRSLIRDKDRCTPVNVPQPEKEEEQPPVEEKKEEKKEIPETSKPKKKDDKKKPLVAEVSDTNSSDATDISEIKDTGRPKRERESKYGKDRKPKTASGEKVKAIVEKFEEQTKKEEEEKPARSKSASKKEPPVQPKEEEKKKPAKEQSKPSAKATTAAPPATTPSAKKPEEEKKKGKKRLASSSSSIAEEKATTSASESSSSESGSTSVPAGTAAKSAPAHNINVGDKLKVYYGPTHESKVTYEAKVIDIDKDQTGPVFLVHYTGWNTRYDEWIQPQRIAENLSASTKAKRNASKQQQSSSPSSSSATTAPSTSSSRPAKAAAKRRSTTAGRVSTSSAGADVVPRSTTPLSVSSTGSGRTKSPATPTTTPMPATRSVAAAAAAAAAATAASSPPARITRKDTVRRTRRISAQTDVSNHTEESDSEGSVSESEPSRIRSNTKTDEPELKTYRRKVTKTPVPTKVDKRKEKEDEDTEKEEVVEKRPVRRTKKIKRSPEKSADESEDEVSPPKGRDFDLNQIRSELKGFTKAIKVSPIDTLEKETVSSSDDSTSPPILEKNMEIEEEVDTEDEKKEKEKPAEKPPICLDVYEFKEPEPFEFESRTKLVDDKGAKKRPRIFDDLEMSPRKNLKLSPSGSSSSEKSEKSTPTTSFRKALVRKQDAQEDSDDDEAITIPDLDIKDKDPFDKLVESPSFNFVKTIDRAQESTSKPKEEPDVSEDSLSLFRELPETVDEYSRDMELSDCESQTQIFTTEPELFSDTFSKPSPDQNTLYMEFSCGKIDEGKLKDSDEDELIREQIQRVIAQSASTDDESNDALLITPPTTSYQSKKREVEPPASPPAPPLSTILGITSESQNIEEKPEEPETENSPASPEEVKDLPPPPPPPLPPPPPPLSPSENSSEKSVFNIDKTTISPALQETDSSLLESIVSQPAVPLDMKLEETAKELANVKTGTKIADSILQKFNNIKNELEKKVTKPEHEEKEDKKSELKFDVLKEETKCSFDVKPTMTEEKPEVETHQEIKEEIAAKSKPTEVSPRKSKISESSDDKKRKRGSSRLYVEEPDEDSTDSDQPLVPKPEQESHINLDDNKNEEETKHAGGDDSFLFASTEEDSQSQETVNFVVELKDEKIPEEPTTELKDKEEENEEEDIAVPSSPCEEADPVPPASTETEPVKEEEPDSHLHSLLLCEEEIPRSPAPETDSCPAAPSPKPSKSMSAEMPFASAPSGSSDTQMGESKKSKDDITMAPCKKRRKSVRSSDENMMTKRGRKTQNRSRHNSDSDDMSEHSNTGSSRIQSYDRANRSPRPSKYNFFVEFDPSLDSGQRIAVLQQKLTELRKTYADVKAELAAVERRRKKIRRREREALKAAKQEMACA
ncbi:unnamed protein product [Acanthoscelides obtectus]|uniref:ARID domain-containing protein n=1 Tax=Acanthoscelides obtectus TaxID=200917 RepID=A0A9P0KSD2_ACAOB|nr:unnamed protein product [Acanthoscelides obtectus]CAK1631915.1 AT-rich interactive domain-containing protein 4B [Acanthoscelides obtectus]